LALRAERKDDNKLAGRGSCDVRMAAAASADDSASNGANSVGFPAGGAGAVTSREEGSRRARFLADNGRNVHGGRAHTGYPDEEEDQTPKLPLLEGKGPSLIRRACFSPPSHVTRGAIPFLRDGAFLDTALTNRRVALVRI